MSIIPSLFGMDNYYDPYKSHARDLSITDIGKKILKVMPARTCFNQGPDCSYTDGVYTLVDLKLNTDGSLHKAIFMNSKGEKYMLDTTKWNYAKQYLSGWVCIDEINAIKPNTKISHEHINYLHDSEKF